MRAIYEPQVTGRLPSKNYGLQTDPFFLLPLPLPVPVLAALENAIGVRRGHIKGFFLYFY